MDRKRGWARLVITWKLSSLPANSPRSFYAGFFSPSVAKPIALMEQPASGQQVARIAIGGGKFVFSKGSMTRVRAHCDDANL